MSYLPRMSKTYKEPEERTEEEPSKEITFNSIPIASAQPDEKAYNSQSVLKQYNYYPHPPPVLPGPSLIQEAEENEKVTIEAKRRRSRVESEATISASKIENNVENPFEANTQKPTVNFALLEVQSSVKTDNKEPVSSVSNPITKPNKIAKKGSIKVNKSKGDGTKGASQVVENGPKPPQNPKKHNENEVIAPGMTENLVRQHSTPVKRTKSDQKIREVSVVEVKKDSLGCDFPVKGSIHEGVQCSPTGASEKVFVMPSCIHNLMRTLSFLVQELDRHEESEEKEGATKEVRKLVAQINDAINILCNRKIESAISLQASLSDRKRLEKIYSDLEQYIDDVYGEKGKLGCKSEERKKLYCKLFQKEYELNVLNEKLRESDIQNPSLTQVEQPLAKAPEVVLQNKNLENEQLRAEVEFNSQELKKFYQALAEKNWEIYKNKEEISAMKKKLSSLKSKTKK